jgi:YidC/Oxa1 family membrane protein insertase
MWLQMKMNPPPTDPTQKFIFGMMPLIFTVSLSHFAVGLVIYWTWSNILSIAQQYVILRRMKVRVL